jgi:hypothetical protein
MKHSIKNTRNIAFGLLTLCVMGVSQTAFAAAKTENPTEIKFIGKVDDQPLFQLNLNNAETGEFTIVIKDNNDNEIFTEKLNGSNLTRKYRIAMSKYDFDAPDFGLTFEVTSSKTKKTNYYKISPKTSVIQGIEIVKL